MTVSVTVGTRSRWWTFPRMACLGWLSLDGFLWQLIKQYKKCLHVWQKFHHLQPDEIDWMSLSFIFFELAHVVPSTIISYATFREAQRSTLPCDSPKWLIWYLSATEYLVVDGYVGPWWLIMLLIMMTYYVTRRSPPWNQRRTVTATNVEN